jgi:hypothetical protein
LKPKYRAITPITNKMIPIIFLLFMTISPFEALEMGAL